MPNLISPGSVNDFTTWTPLDGITVTANAGLAPDGSMTADVVTDIDGLNVSTLHLPVGISSDALPYVFSILVRKTSGATVFPDFELRYTSSGLYCGVVVNTNAGTIVARATAGAFIAPDAIGIQSYNSLYWLVWVMHHNSGDATANCYISPAFNNDAMGAYTVASTGPATIWGAFLEQALVPSRAAVTVANFTAAPPSNTHIAPVTVTFTDTSTYNPISWVWDFGDGTGLGPDPRASAYVFYKLDETVGATIAVDFSGNGRNGSISGSVVAGGSGHFGTSYAFTNGQVLGPAQPVLGASGIFTVAMWVKTTAMGTISYPTDMWIIDTRDASGSGYTEAWIFGLHSGALFMATRDASGVDGGTTLSPTTVNDGTWHHLVGVRNGSVVKLYVDGVLSITGSCVSDELGDGRNISIGMDGRDLTISYVGQLDDVGFWTRELSTTEIKNLYSMPPGYSSQNPVHTYSIHGTYHVQLTATNVAGYNSVTHDYIVPDIANPSIVSVTIDGSNVTSTANAGPTSIALFYTWWEVTLPSGSVARISQLSNQDYTSNHNHSDVWTVPPGENWQGLPLVFAMQDQSAGTIFRSAPFILTDPRFDNQFIPPPQGPVLPIQPNGKPGPGIFLFGIKDYSGRNAR